MSETTTVTINQALADYTEAVRDLDAYRAAQAEVIHGLERRQEDMQLAREALTEAMAERHIDFAENEDFAVTLVISDRGQFDPSKLPNLPEVRECYTIAVDTKGVRNLVKKRVLTAEQIEAAWVSRPSKPSTRITVKRVEDAGSE